MKSEIPFGCRLSICSSIFILFILSTTVFADSIWLLKISPGDGRAVIKTPDGKMQIIKVGDSIGDNGKVVEITKGRVVVEEDTEKGTETIIIRLEDGKQRTERIKNAPDKQPVILSPQTQK